MLNKYFTGNTTENDGLLLPDGLITIDREKKALRFHDGEAMGGYEILGTRVISPPLPGTQEISAGDPITGFYGEVDLSPYLDGNSLASHFGISTGTAYNTATPWLKFALDGKTVYIAKKPIRHGVSWKELYQAGAVYGDDTNGDSPLGTPRLQNAQITMNNIPLRVRLIRGANTDPYSVNEYNHTNPTDVDQSEWERLIVQATTGVLGSYMPDELGVLNGTITNMAYASTMCQERHLYDAAGRYRVIRGWAGSMTRLGADNGTVAGTSWRPVLELIQ